MTETAAVRIAKCKMQIANREVHQRPFRLAPRRRAVCLDIYLGSWKTPHRLVTVILQFAIVIQCDLELLTKPARPHPARPGGESDW